VQSQLVALVLLFCLQSSEKMTVGAQASSDAHGLKLVWEIPRVLPAWFLVWCLSLTSKTCGALRPLLKSRGCFFSEQGTWVWFMRYQCFCYIPPEVLI
jgi:hypothetical protein